MLGIDNSLTTLRKNTIRRLTSDVRNYNFECGYPDEVSAQEYRQFYDRWGVAERAVKVWPKECWQVLPEIIENTDDEDTPFEARLAEVALQTNLFGYMQRIDILSGIGRYGVLMFGFDDGGTLQSEVTPGTRNILYMRTFDESLAEIGKYEDDTTNERFGKPNTYHLKMQRLDGNTNQDLSNTDVHWTRTIHIADNRESDEIFGAPRLRPIYNHVHDIRKIGGGSAEMFWKGGFPGLAITVDPTLDLDAVNINVATMKDEIEKYNEGLDRNVVLTGAQAHTLNPNVADPRGHFEITMKQISIALGVPQRVLLGSESAQLASSQDRKTWQARVKERQEQYVTPSLIRPIVDRLIEVGVLTAPNDGYKVIWPSVEETSQEDKVKIAKIRTEAIAQYVDSGLHRLISPKTYFKLIHSFTDEEIALIEKDMKNFDITTLDNVTDDSSIDDAERKKLNTDGEAVI